MGKYLSNEEFLEKLIVNKGNRFTALEQYTAHRVPMKFRHICGAEFVALPNGILNKRSEGCPVCGAKDRVVKRTKTIQKLSDEVNELYPNKFYVYLDQELKNNKQKIRVKCLQCNNDFLISSSNLLRDRGCPLCCKTIANQSKNSDRIRDYLISLGYKQKAYVCDEDKYFIKEKSFDKLYGVNGKPLRFDFALYNKNKLILLIEYDGEFHFRNPYEPDALKVQQENDNIKNEYCKTNNINLFRLNYKTFKIKTYKSIIDKQLSELNE